MRHALPRPHSDGEQQREPADAVDLINSVRHDLAAGNQRDAWPRCRLKESLHTASACWQLATTQEARW